MTHSALNVKGFSSSSPILSFSSRNRRKVFKTFLFTLEVEQRTILFSFRKLRKFCLISLSLLGFTGRMAPTPTTWDLSSLLLKTCSEYPSMWWRPPTTLLILSPITPTRGLQSLLLWSHWAIIRLHLFLYTCFLFHSFCHVVLIYNHLQYLMWNNAKTWLILQRNVNWHLGVYCSVVLATYGAKNMKGGLGWGDFNMINRSQISKKGLFRRRNLFLRVWKSDTKLLGKWEN